MALKTSMIAWDVHGCPDKWGHTAKTQQLIREYQMTSKKSKNQIMKFWLYQIMPSWNFNFLIG